jgi:hypothetical protein
MRCDVEGVVTGYDRRLTWERESSTVNGGASADVAGSAKLRESFFGRKESRLRRRPGGASESPEVQVLH